MSITPIAPATVATAAAGGLSTAGQIQDRLQEQRLDVYL
jgi:hypothetical protein